MTLLRLSPLALLFLTSACATAGHGERTLTILHTNDMHAGFLPREAAWMRTEPRPLIGGFVELEAAVESIRAASPAVLLVDAGDVMTGNPVSDIEHRGAQGGLLFEMMNSLGYDVWTPGNHDLDISQDNLRALTRVARFPTVSANLTSERDILPVNNLEYVILERGGLRIGVIGLISQQLSSLVIQTNLEGLRVLSPAETARRLARRLDPDTDLLIALTHQGFEDDSLLAADVGELDVIIGGHSHTRLRPPKVINGVIVAQAGSNCENLGVLSLTVAEDRVVRHRGDLLPLWHRARRTGTPVAALVDSIRGVLETQFGEVIATLAEDWKRGGKETNIGSFILEAVREAGGAQAAFVNSHGIRRDVPAGPLTRQELYEVLPFRNVVTTFQLTGRELRAVMRHYVTKDPPIQMSGITCTWDERDGGVEITDLRVQGRAVRDDDNIICATSDYFLGEADRYLGLTVGKPVYLRTTVFDAVEKAARAAGTIATAPIPVARRAR